MDFKCQGNCRPGDVHFGALNSRGEVQTAQCSAEMPDYKIKGGSKNDQGKPRLELIPPFALEEVANVMEFGAEKHGLYSYLAGFSWCEMIGGILRHVYKFIRGED